MGKLMSQLCKMLDIKSIPHLTIQKLIVFLNVGTQICLLYMLKKATVYKKDWDLYLPFVLFAYRQKPHTVTDLSPFQLIYGLM